MWSPKDIALVLTALAPILQHAATLVGAIFSVLAFWQTLRNRVKINQVADQTNGMLIEAKLTSFDAGRAHAQREDEHAAIARAKENTAMQDARDTMAHLEQGEK